MRTLLLLLLPVTAAAADRGAVMDLLRETGAGSSCAAFTAEGDDTWRTLSAIAHDEGIEKAVRGRAVSFLGCFPNETVHAWLSDEIVRGETPLLRAKACGALGTAFPDRAADAVGRGLHDNKPDVRIAAAKALGRLNDAHATRLLRSRLARESDADVKRAIRAALK